MKFSKKFYCAGEEMCSFEKHVPAPYFRKDFELDFIPEGAELTVCGLGFYELWINGENITKCPLAPYISNPDDICYYDNYDITNKLKYGKNTLGFMLGNGFRNSFGGFIWDFDKAPLRGPVCLAFAFEAVSSDKSLFFEADETLLTHPSPVTFDDIRMGCRYDARLELPGWNTPEYNADDWKNAVRCKKPPLGVPTLCKADLIAVREERKAVSIDFYAELPFMYENSSPDAKPYEKSIRKNVYVFDFGVNDSGVTKLKINGKPGQKITIRHAEHNVGGKFSINTISFNRDETRDLYMDYAQTDEYICRGGYEEFVPSFKYDGFRYVYVEGLEKEQVTPELLTFIIESSDVKPRAEFVSSSEELNKLQECVRRSDLSNLFYIPTDCPHREKNGWTGDMNVSSEHHLLNLKSSNTLREWLKNVAASQKPSGELPGIVPTGGWGFEWGNGPSWDAVCAVLPYNLYRFEGDISIVYDSADMIVRYIKFAESRLNEKGLADTGLGDWVDPFAYENGKITAPLEVTSTLSLYDMAVKAQHLFNEACLESEAQIARTFAEKLRNAFRKHLISFPECTAAGDCQTSQAFAIDAGMFDACELPQARKKLVEIIHRDGDVNTCGMLGIRHIYHALTNAGETDLAYKIVLDKSRTCYGHWLLHGITTMCESFMAWDGPYVDSRNHHFLGDISSWFIQDITGLRPNPTATDITNFEICPHFPKKLDSASAVYDSACGKLSVKWERKGNGSYILEIEVPRGCKVRLKLEDGYVLPDGRRIAQIGNGKSEYNCIFRRNDSDNENNNAMGMNV